MLTVRSQSSISRSIYRNAQSQSLRITPVLSAFQPSRSYASHAGLAKDEVQGRILDLLKGFDKVSSSEFRPVNGSWLTRFTVGQGYIEGMKQRSLRIGIDTKNCIALGHISFCQ
jgi:hypothetical protein